MALRGQDGPPPGGFPKIDFSKYQGKKGLSGARSLASFVFGIVSNSHGVCCVAGWAMFIVAGGMITYGLSNVISYNKKQKYVCFSLSMFFLVGCVSVSLVTCFYSFCLLCCREINRYRIGEREGLLPLLQLEKEARFAHLVALCSAFLICVITQWIMVIGT